MRAVRNQKTMTKCITWFLGRGASVASGLSWAVPNEWKKKERNIQISLIKKDLKREMDKIKTAIPYHNLLSSLSGRTKENFCHQFITTNWDYLLEKEIFNLNFKALPKWLCSSFVYHLNGTIEELPDNSNRSPFLLETDKHSERKKTVEANIAFNKISWQQFFIVVGVSFACEMDKYTLSMLQSVEDDLPIGESYWIILNPKEEQLNETARIIQGYLPRAKFYLIKEEFGKWVESGLPELTKTGIFNK